MSTPTVLIPTPAGESGTAVGTPGIAVRSRHRPPPRGRFARLLRGPTDQPTWVRPAVIVLLAATALLYLWGLGASADANSYYAAAVQAGTRSWKAFFFGSLDPSNFITVDKPPASLWVMELSGRIFGFSSWSMLAPQALEGVAAVGLLYAAVRRWSGPVAGLLAGATLAVTPVATLMFRFNNPDALLVLLLVAAGYSVVRATETASTRWLLLAGSLVGFGFLTKMLQAVLVLPAFALVYLVAAPTPVRRRLVQVLGAGLAMVASAGWWVAIVQLWPAGSRPYIGGSEHNSILELTLGYNGLSRITGGEGGGNGASFSGSTGITRLFNSEMGTQISWLLPAALVALAAGLWMTRRAPRTDQLRAAVILWGTWLMVTGLVFSFMKGTVHSYYTVALAPAISALVATVVVGLWRQRDTQFARGALALMVSVTGAWSWVLLGRASSWHPQLRYLVVAAAVIAVVLILFGLSARRLVVIAVAAAMIGLLGGSTAYAVETAGTVHTGSTPSAGPASSGASGFGGGGGGIRGAAGGQRPSGTAGSQATLPGNGASATGLGALPSGGTSTRQGTAAAGGGGGGTTAASSALVTLLKSTTGRWAAATIGAQNAASLQLSSGKAIMAIGGFTGSDPSITLAQFKQYVTDGKIRYFIASGSTGGGGGAAGGTSTSTSITSWVTSTFSSSTVGGQTVYDLAKAASTTG